MGSSQIVHCHTMKVACRIENLICKLDKRSAEQYEESNDIVRFGEACIVKLVPEHPVCVEHYREYPPLGRFIVRDSEKTTAVGIIIQVEKM